SQRKRRSISGARSNSIRRIRPRARTCKSSGAVLRVDNSVGANCTDCTDRAARVRAPSAKQTGGSTVKFRVKRSNRRKFLLALASSAGVIATDALGIEPSSLRLTHFKIGPAPRHRFVQFTDIHHKGDAAFLRKVVETINAQN